MYQETFSNEYMSTGQNIKSFLGYSDDYPIELIINDLLFYLRKSRKDSELYGKEAIEETLARHEKTLQDWALNMFNTPIPETNIFKEVVSGESIEDRPVFQQILKLSENPKIRGIVAVDVQRLGRGDLEDQGKMIKIFKFSNTKILTPNRWYNLSNKFDYESFKSKMRESEEYLSYIKEIMGNGRKASVLAGTWPHSSAPYGFIRKKIDGKKGYTLEHLDEEKKVSKLMAGLLENGLNIDYTIKENDTLESVAKKFGVLKKIIEEDNKNIEFKTNNTIKIKSSAGTSVISNYLNYLNIKPRKSDKWTPNMVRNILKSPAAHGYVSWNNRKTVKKIKDGQIIKSRPRNNDDLIIVKGSWPPIFNEHEQNIINNYFKKHKSTVKHSCELKNPLAGLVVCGVCGSIMQRRPYYQKNKRKKRIYDVNKQQLNKFLRNIKGINSLNEIARGTNISKNIIDHYFAKDLNKFTIPTPENWNKLKIFFKIGNTQFDTQIDSLQTIETIHTDTLLCKNKCGNVASDLILIESKLIKALNVLLENYKNYIDNYKVNFQKEKETYELSLAIIDNKVAETHKKLNKICDFLEQGIYSIELFNERQTNLNKELLILKKKQQELKLQQKQNKFNDIKNIIPEITRVLEEYNKYLSPKEKNKLLSSVIEKVIYTKEKGGKNYKDKFNLKIFPKI
ncbi:MAG: recombinase family protein [Bacilli bacterium]